MDKELLLKDLCTRLPYNVKVCLSEKETCILMGIVGYKVYLDVDSDSFCIESIEPYLRPMSSMTKEERKEYEHIAPGIEVENGVRIPNTHQVDWLNLHHFDYRGLIEKSLALEAPKDMYNIIK